MAKKKSSSASSASTTGSAPSSSSSTSSSAPSAAASLAVGGTQGGIVTDLVDSIFTGGVNPGVKLAVNVSFVLLILSLLLLVVASEFNVHAIAVLVISILLFASVTWFISELEMAKKPAPASVTAADTKKGR